jgi:molybdopterin-guanine dinucleotide biosynthesis protein MobB
VPPVLCVVARDTGGAQAVVGGLVRELTAIGLRVAVIAQSDEEPALDHVSLATAAYATAGGELLMLASPRSVTSIRRAEQQPSLDELTWDIRDDYDIVLSDGFPQSSYLKVEVHHAAEGDKLLCHKNELLAIVGDRPPGLDLPCFAKDDLASLAELVRRRFLTPEAGEDAALFIDGVRMPLALFVRKMVAGIVLGMVRALRGVEDPKSVVVTVRKHR